jgi:Family of unknown function (DUF6476)
MSDIEDAPAVGGQALSANLRFLKILVTVLAGTMIVGLIILIALIVIRFPSSAPRPALPDAIALPAGTKAEAVTFGRGWVAVVTDADEIVIFDVKTGAERQRVRIAPAE